MDTMRRDIVDLQVRVAAIERATFGGVPEMSIADRFTAVHDRIDMVGKNILDRFDEFQKTVDSRFDQMDARLDLMGARFDQMDVRFDRMDTRFDVLEIAVNSTFKKFDARFEKVDAEFGEIKAMLVSLGAKPSVN